jgi:hypothetical protein
LIENSWWKIASHVQLMFKHLVCRTWYTQKINRITDAGDNDYSKEQILSAFILSKCFYRQQMFQGLPICNTTQRRGFFALFVKWFSAQETSPCFFRLFYYSVVQHMYGHRQPIFGTMVHFWAHVLCFYIPRPRQFYFLTMKCRLYYKNSENLK